MKIADVRRRAAVIAAVSFVALLFAACNMAAPSRVSVGASRSMVASGTATSFTVLANAAVTITDGIVTGNVGTFLAPLSGGSVTQTNGPITGSIDIGDATANQAYEDFLTAYGTLTPAPGDTYKTLTGTLAGVTLGPGVYSFDADAALTGVLTLNGPSNGTWIFKIGTKAVGALTGTNFSVVMAGGATPCNVTWWVNAAATMTDSQFKGTILAGAAITLTRGTFFGNAWAGASGAGDVTITGTKLTGCAGGAPAGCAPSSAISSNFNGTPIPGGSSIWFNAVLDLKGRKGPATVYFGASTLQFNGYTVTVPAAVINFSASATTDITMWDAVSGSWVTTVPVGYQGKVFLSGRAWAVPSGGLPGGIKPVTWSGNFASQTQGLTYQWQWGAAVYTMFGPNGSVPIKAIDDTHGSYPNSDHAGTPENFKTYVIGGATGGGGSNWTGSYSGTASAGCQ